MSKDYQLLMEPGYIGNLEIKNRVCYAPMGSANNTVEGHVSPFTLEYYRALAEGGTGLIVVESTYIDREASKGEEGQLCAADNTCTPGLAQLASLIHTTYGCKCALQLCHEGQQLGLNGTLPSWGPTDMPDYLYNGEPSPITGITEDQISQTINNFATCAWRAKVAGFDAVEIHAAGGHLLNMFISPNFNKRTDVWGGNLENRARFLLETVKAVKQACGRDYPILVRFCGDELDEGGMHWEDGVQIARWLEEAGCDALDMNAGSLANAQITPTAFDPAPSHAYISERYKQAGIKIPIIIAGSITTPAIAEEILSKGQADFVGLARPLLADPNWVKKIQAGKADEVKPCIRCCMGCVGSFEDWNAARGLKCSVNPLCNHTLTRKVAPLQKKKNVAVVGGGPAGMEAACLASERGHDVTVFEKRKLGGTMWEAAFDPSFKGDILNLINYYQSKVGNLGIEVVEKEAGVADLVDAGFDAVVVATGAKVRPSKVPGTDRPFVYTDIDVTSGKQGELGQNVLVVGGGVVAAEIAVSEARKGKHVTISTRRGAKMGMYEIANTDSSASWMRLLAELGMHQVDVKLCQTLIAIEDDGAVVADPAGNQTKIAADSIVLCTGYMPDHKLYRELRGKVSELYLVGDANSPRLIGEAIEEGWIAGNTL